MIDCNDLNARAESLSDLLGKKLGLRGSCLATRLSKARRTLPRHLRKSGDIILSAQKCSQHPKLSRCVDPVPVAAAFADLRAYLERIDPSERRKTALLHWLAGQVFNLLLVAVAVIVFLKWRGVI